MRADEHGWIVQQRLHNQHLAQRTFSKPSDVVRWFGAMQAQDYLGALWAVGLRAEGTTMRDVERALADKSIVRTWPMRGTLHLVAREDVRWMLELMAPRMVGRAASRFAKLGLDRATLSRSHKLLSRSLRGKQLTRTEIYEALESAGISTAAQRGMHILWWAAHERLVCCGPRRDKQHTFVLLDEWAPDAKSRPREEALAEIALRYFASHGPATLRDFTWWTGLPAADTKVALATVKGKLTSERAAEETYFTVSTSRRTAPRSAHLLPAFDEYLVGYTDRAAALPDSHKTVVAYGGILSPTMVIDGRVVGTWKRTLDKRMVRVTLSPFAEMRGAERSAMKAPADELGAFLA